MSGDCPNLPGSATPGSNGDRNQPPSTTTPAAAQVAGWGTLHQLAADGRRLEIPPHTPGGNACPLLLRTADIVRITGTSSTSRYSDLTGVEKPAACVLIGGLAADGTTITWFRVLTEHDGLDHAAVGRAVGLRGRQVVTSFGLEFQRPTKSRSGTAVTGPSARSRNAGV